MSCVSQWQHTRVKCVSAYYCRVYVQRKLLKIEQEIRMQYSLTLQWRRKKNKDSHYVVHGHSQRCFIPCVRSTYHLWPPPGRTVGLQMCVAGRSGYCTHLVRRTTWGAILATCHLMSLAKSSRTEGCFPMLGEHVDPSVWYRGQEKWYLYQGRLPNYEKLPLFAKEYSVYIHTDIFFMCAVDGITKFEIS